MNSTDAFCEGCVFREAYKTVFCDAYKTVFNMYAKERDHTVMYIPFKCLFQVHIAESRALGPS